VETHPNPRLMTSRRLIYAAEILVSGKKGDIDMYIRNASNKKRTNLPVSLTVSEVMAGCGELMCTNRNQDIY